MIHTSQVYSIKTLCLEIQLFICIINSPSVTDSTYWNILKHLINSKYLWFNKLGGVHSDILQWWKIDHKVSQWNIKSLITINPIQYFDETRDWNKTKKFVLLTTFPNVQITFLKFERWISRITHLLFCSSFGLANNYWIYKIQILKNQK